MQDRGFYTVEQAAPLRDTGHDRRRGHGGLPGEGERHHAGEMFGIAPTGKSFSAAGLCVIRRERISCDWGWWGCALKKQRNNLRSAHRVPSSPVHERGLDSRTLGPLCYGSVFVAVSGISLSSRKAPMSLASASWALAPWA